MSLRVRLSALCTECTVGTVCTVCTVEGLGLDELLPRRASCSASSACGDSLEAPCTTVAGRTGAAPAPMPVTSAWCASGSGSSRAMLAGMRVRVRSALGLRGGANAVRRALLGAAAAGTPGAPRSMPAPSGPSRPISSHRSISAPQPLISAEITQSPPAGSRPRLCSLVCRPLRGDDAVCGTACSGGVCSKGRPNGRPLLLVRSASSLLAPRAPRSSLWRGGRAGDRRRAPRASGSSLVWRDGGRDCGRGDSWAPSAVAARLERPMLLRALGSKRMAWERGLGEWLEGLPG